MTQHGLSVRKRFWMKVEKGSSKDCWIWTGARLAFGYGVINVGGKSALAHRLSWILNGESIPMGLFVLHRCDNPPCVNPNHLFLGTKKDNTMDAYRKGRLRAFKPMPGESNPNSKLTRIQVWKIREQSKLPGATKSALAKAYGISRIQIGRIISRESWATV